MTIYNHNSLHPFCHQMMKFFIVYRVNRQFMRATDCGIVRYAVKSRSKVRVSVRV